MSTSRIFHKLNDSQKAAVTAVSGPLLIVAGPGTGKTLTIVRRIAYLIDTGVSPENILAVTFTNRAAREMRERAEAVLDSRCSRIFIGTFHLLGLRILKENLSDDFVILGRDEQVSLVKALLKKSGTKARQVAERISRIKGLAGRVDDEIKDIYEAYQSALKKESALDFDDLILQPLGMLAEKGLVEKYRERFMYIIVDEYQDINPAQYKLLALLAGSAGNICAVGDSDQAIYSFRGADMDSFLNFEKDFRGARKIFLSDSYRSTGTILGASGSLIKNNARRIDRKICTVRERGRPVRIISVPDERMEGEMIIREIERRIGGTSHYQMRHTAPRGEPADTSYSFADFAVIFRTNAQAKAIEDAFIKSGIPYQVIGRSAPPVETAGISADEAALMTPADFFDPRADAVALMTLHMAKGLEFSVVFIAGVEEGIIPYTLNHDQDSVDMEEERRLFYVGMTRAADELFLIHARKRFLYGQRLALSPSPFISEVPGEFIHRTVVAGRDKRRKQDKQMGLF
ncbi:MAG: UvrD-helicase domain-containing protein [Deferribacteres bacterium]|nr:UvrD-helicase domain-containing protein [Deferribacteres bacterium]